MAMDICHSSFVPSFDIGVDVLGLKKIKHRDWFNDNSVEINSLLDEKQKLHQKLVNCSKRER